MLSDGVVKSWKYYTVMRIINCCFCPRIILYYRKIIFDYLDIFTMKVSFVRLRVLLPVWLQLMCLWQFWGCLTNTRKEVCLIKFCKLCQIVSNTNNMYVGTFVLFKRLRISLQLSMLFESWSLESGYILCYK